MALDMGGETPHRRGKALLREERDHDTALERSVVLEAMGIAHEVRPTPDGRWALIVDDGDAPAAEAAPAAWEVVARRDRADLRREAASSVEDGHHLAVTGSRSPEDGCHLSGDVHVHPAAAAAGLALPPDPLCPRLSDGADHVAVSLERPPRVQRLKPLHDGVDARKSLAVCCMRAWPAASRRGSLAVIRRRYHLVSGRGAAAS
jgi:hypothetical protein